MHPINSMVLTGLEVWVQAGGMFERFTPYARRAIVMAQEEAREMNHNYIGTEHILIALIRPPDGLPQQSDLGASGVLAEFGMTLDGVRQEVRDKVGAGKGTRQSGHIPFTPRAKKVLELSLREALQLHHDFIGTEHILLGLIREDEGVAAQILREHADLLAIRSAVFDRIPPGSEEGADVPTTSRGALMRRWRQRLGGTREEGGVAPMGATPAVDATLAEAARLAGEAPVGSHHLLLAALADPDSAAARTLAGLGVDLDQARELLRNADLTGTSDEPPEEAGRRQMVVQVTGETLTIVVVDPVLVAAGVAALAAVNAKAETAGESKTGDEGTGTSAATTVIRGDHPAAASLAGVWLELRKSLTKIAAASATSSSSSSAAD
jgi:ATP-dependent Clp protease ATP-binding subunit ClpA